MNAGQREALEFYDNLDGRLHDEGKLADDECLIVDLDQSEGRPRYCIDKVNGNLMTLICHGFFFHLRKRCMMLAQELALAQGWPIGLEPGNPRSTLDWEVLLAGQLVSHRNVTSWVGDSWHLVCQGSFLMWLWANIELAPRKHVLHRMQEDIMQIDSDEGCDNNPVFTMSISSG